MEMPLKGTKPCLQFRCIWSRHCRFTTFGDVITSWKCLLYVVTLKRYRRAAAFLATSGWEQRFCICNFSWVKIVKNSVFAQKKGCCQPRKKNMKASGAQPKFRSHRKAPRTALTVDVDWHDLAARDLQRDCTGNGKQLKYRPRMRCNL